MKQSSVVCYQVGLCCASLWLGAVVSGFGAAKPSVDPLDFTLVPIGTYANGAPYDQAAAKVVTHDPLTQRLYVANGRDNRIEVLDIQDPTQLTEIGQLDMNPYGAVVNGVAVRNGLLAVCVQNEVKTSPGNAVFFDRDLQHLNTVPVGALPDFIVFSPDGRWVLVSNEGEPNTYNNFGEETNGPSIDPEGSITIIDLSTGVATPTVATATFTAFNGATLDPSIRIFGPNASVAQDLEPESIAVSADSTTAFVTLQENNAMAIVDVASATVIRLVGLGFKDCSQPGYGLDASDQDGPLDSKGKATTRINIANWPVWAVYMPDEVAAYQYQGQTFLVMANEGDVRDYPGYKEDARVSALTLDATAFPNAAELQQSNNLGRLQISKVGGDADGDGDYDFLFATGGRSLTIRTADGQVVFDSGDQFEQATAALLPAWFNCNNTANKQDARSTSKGPEPEGVVLGKVAGRMLAFIGFERIGGIIVYDVSNPYNPELVDYVNTRNFAGTFSFETAGDLGPEGLKFISAEESPNGKPLLAVANEVSGSVTLFQINKRAYKAEL